MGLTNLLPRTVNTTGAGCTGSDGNPNRQLTLPDSSTLSTGVDIAVSGATLHEGAGLDFTMSAAVITFLNPIFNADVIRINYFITFGAPAAATLSTSTSLKYATPFMFGQSIGIIKDIPSWDIGLTPTNEAVGTGNGVLTTFYLDQKSVVSDSYYLYAAGVLMTETTHYILDCDSGTIVLTAAGVSMLASTALTAKYSYYDNGMKDSYLISVLSRAEKEIDNMINSTFTDGNVTNPEYPIEIEVQPTQGMFITTWFTRRRPIVDIESIIAGDITSTATTLNLTSSSGGEKFPTSGYIIIGSEIITYTGITSDTLTGLSRGVLGTTAAAHVNGETVHTTIILVSDTAEGTAESWTVQPWSTHIHSTDDGVIYRYHDASPDVLPSAGVENRFKIIYLYGYNYVPGDITRLTILVAKRMLINDTIGKSLIAGRNEFRPEMVNVDLEEIERIKNNYIVLQMGNV